MIHLDSIGVLIATDFRLYREGLEAALPAPGLIRVVGAAATSNDALSLIRELKPDVVLIDPVMPRSRSVARGAYRSAHPTKVIILGLADVEVEVISWATEGIDGFVTRRNSLDELVLTIQNVTCGKWRCSPSVARALLGHMAKLGRVAVDSECALQLTEREYEISYLIAHGLSNKEIARSLEISVSTTKNHVHSILVKLGLKRRMQVANWIHEETHQPHTETIRLSNPTQ